MIDRSRIPANMGVHEYLMTFDEPRQRPEPHKRSPEDHTRRDWILYEREQLAKAERHDEEFGWHIRSLLVQAKHQPETRNEIHEAFRLQGIATALQFGEFDLVAIIDRMKEVENEPKNDSTDEEASR